MKVMLHWCGAVSRLIPSLIEMGVDVLNPVQVNAKGIDPKVLKDTYGGKIAFWGGSADCQRTLSLGTPEDVAREVETNVHALAPGGGYICAAGITFSTVSRRKTSLRCSILHAGYLSTERIGFSQYRVPKGVVTLQHEAWPAHKGIIMDRTSRASGINAAAMTELTKSGAEITYLFLQSASCNYTRSLRRSWRNKMRISKIETYLVGNPWKNWLFVKVSTDEGIYGLGEGSLGRLSKTVEAAIHEMKPLILGLEVFQTELLVERLSRHVYADGGQIKMCAISALEIACRDAIGKAVGQPVYNLVGGRCHDRVRAYANGWYTTDRTPEAFAAAAIKVLQRGYGAMKFDPFGSAMGILSQREEALLSRLSRRFERLWDRMWTWPSNATRASVCRPP